MNEKVFITKMAVKALGCKPEGKDDGTSKRLCVIFGRADGIKMGEGKDGKVWTAITGTFEGVNLESGAVYQSGKLFLPGGIQETVENAVKAIPADSGLSVNFGLEIRSVKASNPIGYTYQAVQVLPVEESDELSSLRRAIVDAGKTALPEAVRAALAAAPVAETTIETPAAPVPVEVPKQHTATGGKRK